MSSHGDRLRNYDDRDRDRFGVGARRSTSPRRIEKKDNLNRDSVCTVRGCVIMMIGVEIGLE